MSESLWFAFDALLVLSLWTLGWLACATQEVRRAIALFIAFGLLLALTWARLNAPDLALAEAIIGAGISGALLLAAAREHNKANEPTAQPAALVWLVNLLSAGLFVVMSLSLWHGMQSSSSQQLAEQVQQLLPQTGVSNPVTAVLLNFRAYDTLLELAVVLTAVMAIVSLGPMRQNHARAGFLLAGLVQWLVPLLVLTSGYLLWVGAHAPGGAFQAGALLASALILLHMSQLPGQPGLSLPLLRLLLVIGVGVFVAVGMATMLFDDSFLAYPTAWAGALILLIETAATLSIAAALTLAYVGGHPPGWTDMPQAAAAQHDGEVRE